MFHDFVISIRLEYVPSSAPFGAPSPQGEGKGRSRASAVNNHLPSYAQKEAAARWRLLALFYSGSIRDSILARADFMAV